MLLDFAGRKFARVVKAFQQRVEPFKSALALHRFCHEKYRVVVKAELFCPFLIERTLFDKRVALQTERAQNLRQARLIFFHFAEALFNLWHGQHAFVCPVSGNSEYVVVAHSTLL